MTNLFEQSKAEVYQDIQTRQKRQATPAQPLKDGDGTAYGLAALEAECAKVAACRENRNETLNAAAFVLGQLHGGGELTREIIESRLYDAACQCGLDTDPGCGPAGIKRTIKSGIEKGMLQPRQADKGAEGAKGAKEAGRDKSGQEGHFVDKSGQKGSPGGQKGASGGQPEGSRFEGNLSAEIREWVNNSVGCFTVADVDREFGLATRADKKLRSRILSKIYKEKNSFLKKDDRKAGVFHILKKDIDFFSILDVEDKPFPITLPFNLHEMVRIPEKGLVIVAGVTNAGKSCFAVNTLRANLDRGFQLVHLINEGRSEFRGRVERLGDDLEKWQALKIAECSAGYAQIIHGSNQEGLTCVDYLREKEGEFYRISSDIQAIADALTTGVAMVCIQKAKGASYGRGGESTMEAARLYLTLDLLADTKRGSINALKIQKAKDYPDENPNGLELHFRISKGVHMEPLSSWGRIDDKQRAEMVKGYMLHHG